MSMIKNRLKSLGEKIKINKEPDQAEQVREFLGDLKDLTESIDVLLDDVSTQFNNQVISKRPLIEKTLSALPAFLQPSEVKMQNAQSKEFKTVKSRIHNINLSIDRIGGFLVLYTPYASEISGRLKKEGVWTDYRADRLRLGPAPYLSDEQLINSVNILTNVVNNLNLPY